MGHLTLFNRQSAPPSRQDGNLSYPLIHLSKHDPWTIGDSFEHTFIVGETGSGKTTGSGQNLALAMLRAGYGGLVLTHKSDEVWRWVSYLKAAGRSRDLILVSPDTPWRFNFLDYSYSRPGQGSGLTQNVVSGFMNVMESRHRGGQRQTQEQFWSEYAGRLMFHGLEALRHAGEPITMDNLMTLLTTAPYDVRGKGLTYPPGSYCEQVLRWANHPPTTQFFENEWAKPGAEKQNAGVLATFTGMAHPFTQDPINELFCTTTNFTPDDCRQGAVIVVGLPTLDYEEVGRTAQLTIKYLWQRAMLRRAFLSPGERPTFLWVDEAQRFVNPFDNSFFDAARSHYVAGVYLTQSVNAIYSAMTPGMHEQQGNALLANFSTKIFHRNSDVVTNRFASETISKSIIRRRSGNFGYSTNYSTGGNKGLGRNAGWSVSETPQGGNYSYSGGDSYSEGKSWSEGGGYNTTYGWQEADDYLVRPELFTHLASGGWRSRWRVQAIAFKAGRHWRRTGQNFLDVSFRQR